MSGDGYKIPDAPVNDHWPWCEALITNALPCTCGFSASTALERALAAINDPEHKNRLAAYEAARTDPYRWYCRLCGETGENADRTIRNAEAYAHVGADGPHAKPTVADSETGRLLHVWCY